jgi:dTDP-glucose 4,6-dehydratase
MENKVVLVTGGAGFIGSHLVDALVEKNRVICIDNLSTGKRNNISHLLKHKNFRFVNHDVSKPLKIAGKIDCIFHLSSPASPVDYQKLPIETMMANSLGTRNMLELAKEKKAKFLLASTSEVYGDPEKHPQREDYWGNVNPIGPRSPYDESKRFAEALTMAYYRIHDVDVRIARIFNTYGPRMRANDGRVIPNFITQSLRNEPITVYGDGKQTRSFCYVSDMVEGLIKLMESECAGEPFNLGNTNEIKIIDLAKKFVSVIGTESKIVFGRMPEDDPERRRPDIAKSKNKLDWEPKIGFDEGLKKTIDWFRENA